MWISLQIETFSDSVIMTSSIHSICVLLIYEICRKSILALCRISYIMGAYKQIKKPYTCRIGNLAVSALYTTNPGHENTVIFSSPRTRVQHFEFSFQQHHEITLFHNCIRTELVIWLPCPLSTVQYVYRTCNRRQSPTLIHWLCYLQGSIS